MKENNKKIKERTKSNLTNYIYKNILERLNKKEKENETKKELVISNKPNKKKMQIKIMFCLIITILL